MVGEGWNETGKGIERALGGEWGVSATHSKSESVSRQERGGAKSLDLPKILILYHFRLFSKVELCTTGGTKKRSLYIPSYVISYKLEASCG